MICATLVAQAEPFMPMPSSKMKTWLRMRVGDRGDHHHGHGEAHRGDAVEEAHRRPAHRADERAAHARHPVFERQRFDVRVETERMQQRRPANASPRNSGTSASEAHNAFHSARDACAPRRLP